MLTSTHEVREVMCSATSGKKSSLERVKIPNPGGALAFLKSLFHKAVRRRKLSIRYYIAIALFIMGAGLLAYSFYYVHYYDIHGSAESFFPWKWMVIYHSLSSIRKEFYDGVAVSSFLFVVSILIFMYSLFQVRMHPVLPAEPAPEIVAARKAKHESRRLKMQKAREDQTIFTYVESKLHRKSRMGAIVLSILAIAALVASYKFPGPVIDFSSVIAFFGVLILIFVDTSQTIQARIVDRVMESSKALVDELSSGLGDVKYLYVQIGNAINSIFVVPLEGANQGVVQGGTPSQLVTQQKELHLIPLGRGLAELYIKELGIPKPSFEDIQSSSQRIFCQTLHLASDIRIERSGDRIDVVLNHPVFKSSCNPTLHTETLAKPGCLGCEVCSLHAVFASYSLSKSVSIEECYYDLENDSTLVALKVEQK
ncbi:MAG: hypothetical protein M1368_07585 [Thaumarchaeota archaeon]|nr:hypothetical protein [Nitrososphaerota archaeon]